MVLLHMNTDLLATVDVAIATEVQEVLTLLRYHFAYVTVSWRNTWYTGTE